MKSNTIMARHIGIVACSAEGASLCYRTICIEGSNLLGDFQHPEISMHTHSLHNYMVYVKDNNWEKVAELMLDSTKKLSSIGAELAICPDNTIHEAFDLMIHKSPIPWLHIADVVAAEAKKQDYKNLAILGTKYLMTGPVYTEILNKHNISSSIPDKIDREKIDRIIFDEHNSGIFSDKSRLYLNEVIQQLKNHGCDAVVLGCTELPLIVNPKNCPLPTLNSTRLLARAALNEAIREH